MIHKNNSLDDTNINKDNDENLGGFMKTMLFISISIFIFTGCQKQPLTKVETEEKSSFILNCIENSTGDKKSIEHCEVVATGMYG